MRVPDLRPPAPWTTAIRAAFLAVSWIVGVAAAHAAEPVDAWCPGASLPSGLSPAPDLFETLAATAVLEDRRLAVVWNPGLKVSTNGVALVHASTGAPGHWASRDWRSWRMERTEAGWRALVPLESVEMPLAYFVGFASAVATNCSPVRSFRTAGSDLVTPTFVFNGFLEGFEEGLEAWEPTVAGISERSMVRSTNALTGRYALRLEVPAGRASMTVGTTRVRGWMLEEYSPVALRFAARTESGNGRIACVLHGNARTPNVAVYPTKAEFTVGRDWRRFEVPMEAFTGLRPGMVDAFTLQFRSESGRALLVDDLELVLR